MAKCRVCKQEHSNNEMLLIKPRFYVCNEECKNEYENNEAKKKSNNKPKLSDSEKEAYKRLISYLCELHLTDKPAIIWLSQIKQLKETHNMKYEGMLLSLQYYIEIEGEVYDPKFGFRWVLEKYYDIAKDFYIANILNARRANEAQEDVVVEVKPNTSQIRINQYKSKVRGVLD